MILYSTMIQAAFRKCRKIMSHTCLPHLWLGCKKTWRNKKVIFNKMPTIRLNTKFNGTLTICLKVSFVHNNKKILPENFLKRETEIAFRQILHTHSNIWYSIKFMMKTNNGRGILRAIRIYFKNPEKDEL